MFFSPQVKRSTTNNNKLVYTSHLTSYRKTHPHGIIAAGGALVPTQEKKKRLKISGNSKSSGNYQNFIELKTSAQLPPQDKNLADTSKKLMENRN